jgi:acetyl-CoA carboxylase biotin carboxyl carrier protein
MDIRTIKKLIELVTKDSEIGEIEVKEGDKSIRVSRYSSCQLPSTPIQYSGTHHLIPETPPTQAVQTPVKP